MEYKSKFLQTLSLRGLLHDGAGLAELDDILANKTGVLAYIGFDCTADSLHIGSLLPLILLRHFQDSGHCPIVLLGGGTTKIGDPSGKDSARKMLDNTTIEANKKGIEAVIRRFISFDGANGAQIVDNDTWLNGLGYIDFLRDVGAHFSINRMLTFDSVKLRLQREQNLSFLEFNYMLLQAFDFLHLFDSYNCVLQMGGSDQWGNIICGVELVRRMRGQTVFAITTPLLTTSTGAKMGKTADGAVWLSADKVSPYDFWQYWRNVDDADVGRFLRLFTTVPLAEIDELTINSGAAINQAKIRLANELTTLCHGDDEAKSAQATAHLAFSGGGLGDDIPLIKISGDIAVVDLLVNADFSASRAESKRLLQQGGVKINGVTVTDLAATLSPQSDVVALQVGKKKHARVSWDQ